MSGLWAEPNRTSGFTKLSRLEIKFEDAETKRKVAGRSTSPAIEQRNVVKRQIRIAESDGIDSVANINQNPLYYASLLEGVVGRSEMSDSTSPQSFGIGYDGRRWLSALTRSG